MKSDVFSKFRTLRSKAYNSYWERRILAEVGYLYGDYKYTDLLKDYEQTAINSKVGKYSSVDNSSYTKNNTEKQDEKKKDSTKEKIKNKILKYLSKLIDEILDEIFK